MAYATYEDYTTIYFGSVVPETDFARVSERASEYLEYVTYKKIETAEITKDIVKCTCALSEAIYKHEQTLACGDLQKASEKVGEYSVNYIAANNITLEDKQNEIAKQYLIDTGLLYRGC